MFFVWSVQGEDVHKIINEVGCLSAGEEWLERNLLLVAGVAVGVAFLQVTKDTKWFIEAKLMANKEEKETNKQTIRIYDQTNILV